MRVEGLGFRGSPPYGFEDFGLHGVRAIETLGAWAFLGDLGFRP